MKEDARSLNLSNAVAILLYEACRQRGFDKLRLQGSKEFE
jgi:tRNA(Leu) C34 or U34 (ribose-2'-O)-methylase TrmL